MIFFILLLFISFIEYFISKFTENTKFKYDKSIFKSFYSYLFNLPLNYVHVKNSGEIIKRVNDLEDVNEVITNSFIVILTNTIVIVSIFTVIYFLTKPIFLILIIFCLLFILTAIFLYKQITDKMNMVISSATNYDSNLHDYINGIVEFRAADDENPVACYMVFLTQEMADKSVQGKRFKVYQGEYPGYIDMADGSKYTLIEEEEG